MFSIRRQTAEAVIEYLYGTVNVQSPANARRSICIDLSNRDSLEGSNPRGGSERSFDAEPFVDSLQLSRSLDIYDADTGETRTGLRAV